MKDVTSAPASTGLPGRLDLSKSSPSCFVPDAFRVGLGKASNTESVPNECSIPFKGQVPQERGREKTLITISLGLPSSWERGGWRKPEGVGWGGQGLGESAWEQVRCWAKVLGRKSPALSSHSEAKSKTV